MIAKILKEINERLARIERRLTTINIDGEITMASLDALTAAVAAETSVNASAIALINGFAAQLAAAGTDPAALAALASQVTANASALAAAVSANTPAAAPPAAPTTPATPAA